MKDRVLNVLLAVVFAALSILSVEWGLGLYAWSKRGDERSDPAPYYPYSFNTSYGARIGGEGYNELAMHPFAVYINLPGQQKRFFTTDEQGFRGPRRARDPAKSKTIVVVGGSAAFGTGLESDAETFPARLEAGLHDVGVINAAAIGHLSGQELAYLVAELVDLKPDLVIAVDGFNDLIDQQGGERRTIHTAGVNNAFFLMERRLHRLYRQESGGLLRRILAAFPLVFTNTARLLWLGGEAIDRAPSPDSHRKGGVAIDRKPETLARLYAANVVKMSKVAAAFGARFLCVIQPDQQSFLRGRSGDKLSRSYQLFRSEARRWLQASGVEHIDLNESPGAFEFHMFMDRVHPDARGQQVLADIVGETIRERALLEPVGLPSR